jgi:hypothetical protein
MPHNSQRHSRRRRSRNKIKYIRYSFAIYACLLAIFLFNVFFHPNKTFLIVEAAFAGIAYLVNLQSVVKNSSRLKAKELTFYLISHVIIAMSVLFFILADKWAMTNVSQITGIEN